MDSRVMRDDKGLDYSPQKKRTTSLEARLFFYD